MQTSETPRDPHLWKQAQERVGFLMHLRSYLIVNAGLWLIYLISNGSSSGFQSFRFPWPLFPMLGWGIGLASHYFAVYLRPDRRSLIEREYEKLKGQQL